MINIEDFAKVDFRVGTILTCDFVEGSQKLYRLSVDFGEGIGKRQILTGLAQYYTSEELTGFQTIFIVNLEPRSMMGMTSEGMLVTVGTDHTKKPSLIKFYGSAENGEGLS
jgi:methionyl-tRNA synthetase